MAKAKDKAPAEGPAKGFRRVARISAMADGYRRGGLKHTKAPKDHPIESLTDEQIEALTNDPRISLQYVDVPDAPEPKEGE